MIAEENRDMRLKKILVLFGVSASGVESIQRGKLMVLEENGFLIKYLLDISEHLFRFTSAVFCFL